jgi:hypothetical protein
MSEHGSNLQQHEPEQHEPEEVSSRNKKYKIAAIILSICGLLYGVAYGEHGTIAFTLSSSIMAIFAVSSPSELSPKAMPRIFG